MTQFMVSPEEPCHLLQLPDEVKLEIVKNIHRKKDLYNFSLACRNLEDMALGHLYRTIDLDILGPDSPNWSQDAFPAFRLSVLENMRELSIRNGIADKKSPLYNKRTRSDANSMDGYVSEVIQSVPQQRLKTFSFLHQTPLSSRMMGGLKRSHSDGLQHLHCCEIEHLNEPEIDVPINLQSLECRSILSGETAAKLIDSNRDTLKTLRLGQDKPLLQQYRQRRIGFLLNVVQPCSAFHASMDFSSMPNLRNLSLVGLDLEPLLQQAANSANFFIQLKSLTLESCPNTAPFLDIVTRSFTSLVTPEKPSLRKFHFRHELFTAPLQMSLTNFLNSFSTLRQLSLLTENANFTTSLSDVLKSHGQTLTHLTLESRIKPREHLHIDTSRPYGQSATPQAQLWLENITDICTLCPNLEELGTALPWNEEVVHPQIATIVQAKLVRLKILHIRNFPSSQSQNPVSQETLEGHAQKFITQCPLPSLEILAIGPTVYSSRWRLSASATSPTSARSDNRNTTTSSPPSSSPPAPASTTPTITTAAIPYINNTAHLPPSQRPHLTTTTSTQLTPRRRNPPTLRALATTLAIMTAKKHPSSPPSHLCTHYFTITRSDRSKSRKLDHHHHYMPSVDDNNNKENIDYDDVVVGKEIETAGSVLHLEQVTERKVEELRGGRDRDPCVGLGGIFEGVWLR